MGGGERQRGRKKDKEKNIRRVGAAYVRTISSYHIHTDAFSKIRRFIESTHDMGDKFMRHMILTRVVNR